MVRLTIFLGARIDGACAFIGEVRQTMTDAPLQRFALARAQKRAEDKVRCLDVLDKCGIVYAKIWRGRDCSNRQRAEAHAEQQSCVARSGRGEILQVMANAK
jgi:hypothetical protein